MAVFLVAAAFIGGFLALPQANGVVQVTESSLSAQSISSIAPGIVSVAQGAEIDNASEITQNPPAILDETALDNEDQLAVDSNAYNAAAIQDPGLSIIVSPTTNANDESSAGVVTSTLPNFNKYFIMPTKGYNYGILHNYNAVDIANACGTSVVAAASGVVIPDPNIPDVSGGWNGGYGNFVLIQHTFGNGVRTRYAHLEQILVQIGDVVTQGQEIGLMGETGDATGCHVHFEVIGAQNPFAK